MEVNAPLATAPWARKGGSRMDVNAKDLRKIRLLSASIGVYSRAKKRLGSQMETDGRGWVKFTPLLVSIPLRPPARFPAF